MPSLIGAFASADAFGAKFHAFVGTLHMLATTMLGPIGLGAFVLAIVVPVPARSRVVLFAWLAAALAYAYVVVTVERVDYYLYPIVPLAAVWTGGLVAALRDLVPSGPSRRVAFGAFAAIALVALVNGRTQVAPYYRYGKAVYRQAKALDASLPPGRARRGWGHYDPSVLYYIDRKGWEEDPYLWTPFDEESAIRKGARAFIAIEKNRLARNVELHAWLLRFPIANVNAAWPVYITDDAPHRAGRRKNVGARFGVIERTGTLPQYPGTMRRKP